jgi:hypothetical protein
VKVRLVYDDAPRTPNIVIHVKTDGGGGSLRSNYLTAFGVEHTILLKRPAGVGMPMSVKVQPNAVFEHDGGGQWLEVYVRADGGSGTTGRLPWSSAFGPEYTVILEPPAGGVPMKAKEVRRRATRQERKRIEAIGGKAHRGSGALAGHKSDGSTDRWRMENKFTTADSYRVTLADLTKLRSECRGFQAPVFNVEFQERHTGAVRETWVLVPATEWERLVNAQNT